MTGPARLVRPRRVAEVSALLGGARPVAGGTDLLVQRRAGAPHHSLVDLTGLEDAPPPLRVTAGPSPSLVLSAVAPIAVVVDALDGRFPALADAAAFFASQQIRNRATIGGNLATGSPAADTVPPLLAAGAVVTIRGADGEREAPLEDFLLGPRAVDLRPAEWILAVTVPAPPAAGGYRKVGGRRALAISFLDLAWQWRADDGVLRDVRLAMGSVAPTVVRLRGAEAELEGRRVTPDVAHAAIAAVQADIHPIDDLRASAGYRRRCAAGLLREALGSIDARHPHPAASHTHLALPTTSTSCEHPTCPVSAGDIVA
ncbi:FAD binding domain-containing protein [Cellulomonas timonensis]|uniref:FAD binding domain-containing protein n=1 Tax=Cellulomonas timonensis TaxID=1689271 RepID=UPI000831FF59|nr:FAD binding domain-containing protein [Cellulomonas timonensis]